MALALINRLLHWMIIGVISPVIVLFMSSKGITISEIGIVMGILSLSVVTFELPSGVLSDQIGRKKIYMLSMVLFALSFCLMLFLEGLIGICIAISIFGIARAFTSGSIESDFIDDFLEHKGGGKLDHLITGMGIAETIGLAGGSVIGGILPALTKSQFPTLNPFTGNIIFQIALVFLIMVMIAIGHKTRKASGAHGEKFILKDIIESTVHSKVIVTLLFGALIWGFAFAALEVYWQPQLKNLMGGEERTEIFGAINGGYFLVGAVGTFLGSVILKLFRNRHFYAACILRILLGFGFVLLALQSQTWAFTAVYLLLMGFNGILSVPEHTLFNLNVHESKRATMLSVSSLILQLGGIVSSVLLSFFVMAMGIPMVLILCGGVLTFSAVVYYSRSSFGKA